MRILYGVQGTGNGHLSRARAMNHCFSTHDVKIDYVFSGRNREDYFDMEPFGDFRVFSGLTFSTEKGRIKYLKTLLNSSPLQFIRDVKNLDVSGYDVIINDFEPVTAWAGKLAKKTVINIGHQQAFDFDIPVEGNNFLAKLVMKYFAPGNVRLGLHWHHFDFPILPPIIDADENRLATIDNKVVVYLPFESAEAVRFFLMPYSDYQFYVYSPLYKTDEDFGHIHQRKVALQGFKNDLSSASGVICNAGFETPSECLQLGKRILVKPVDGQMEQLSNAKTLELLGLGYSMHALDHEVLANWLANKAKVTTVHYPDTAAAIVKWILDGDWGDRQKLADQLWSQVQYLGDNTMLKAQAQ